MLARGIKAVPTDDVQIHLHNGWHVLAVYSDHALMHHEFFTEGKSK